MNADNETLNRDGSEQKAKSPQASDNTYPDDRQKDNLHTAEQENSANGLDSQDDTGGQNGRNIRPIGSTDMDSEHGVLRQGDMDNSTMEITDQGREAAASEAGTKTSTTSYTTAGPDDYASEPEVNVPSAQEEVQQQGGDTPEADADRPNSAEEDQDIAETGTSIDHKPTY